MLNKPAESEWLKRARLVVAVGLLAYLASFFFLGSSQQKTLFYLLVAGPSLFLLGDFRHLLREYRPTVSLILAFLAYFALSSLWANDGRPMNGLKVASCVVSLMLATHSTMSMRADSGARLRCFLLVVGSCSACLYSFMIIIKVLQATEYATLWSQRYSVRTVSGWGDSNPINSAIYFGAVTLVAWWVFPRQGQGVKLGLLLLSGACVVFMFLTQSRGPVLALVIALCLMALIRRQRDDFILWAISLTAGVAAVLFFDLTPSIVDRAVSPNYRVGIWLNAIDAIRDNPLFGQGLGDSADIPISMGSGAITIVGHSHSSILEVFRAGGFLGGFLFLAMILSVIRQSAIKDREHQFFLLWFVFGLLCLSTNGRLPVIRPSIEWFAFWIPLFLLLFTPPDALPPAALPAP